MKKIAFLFISLSYLCFFAGWIATKNIFPPFKTLHPQLLETPQQAGIEKDSFSFIQNENSYTIKPVMSYEMSALIVSERKDNFLHEKSNHDYLNVKDICVVWGDNIKNESYKNYSFNNNTYACFSQKKTNTRNSEGMIPSAVSNNHLITDKPDIAKKIKQAKTGDQIHLKGYLSHYSTNGGPFRSSSLTRHDTGNGACETIYVTDFKILKKSSRLNSWLFFIGSILLPCGVILAFFFRK